MTPIIIDIPMPPMGGKIWVLDAKGMFVLEQGPGTLRTIACTHGGSGTLVAVDGIPDERGFFDGTDLRLDDMPTDPALASFNGRRIYRANPTMMGSWMLDGGFHHGLTILSQGGTESANAIASIVWVPAQRKLLKP